MILADSFIDDEQSMLPINLNGGGKKDGKDTNTLMVRTRIHKKKRLMPSVVLEKRKGQCWDPKITGSGHLAPKTFRYQALG